MDWFERLTGFRETDYDDTRAKLKVEGSRLQSLVNGKSYGIGELELVSLQALRERVKSAGGLPGRLKVSVVTGDVRQMHQSPENAGALFQVASQFNLLEMISPTSDAGAWRHPLPTRPYSRPRVRDRRRRGHDLPQLLRASRRQRWPDNGTAVRRVGRSRRGSGRRPKSAGRGIMEHAKRLCAMHPRRARRHCGASRGAATGAGRYPARQTVHRGAPRRGSHRCRREHRPLVSQAFCSALPVAYTRVPPSHWEAFASLVLQAAYEATMLAAVLNAQRGASNVVLLTQLGGGAFGNHDDWIHAAMRRCPRDDVGVRTRCEACELWDAVARDLSPGRILRATPIDRARVFRSLSSIIVIIGPSKEHRLAAGEAEPPLPTY